MFSSVLSVNWFFASASPLNTGEVTSWELECTSTQCWCAQAISSSPDLHLTDSLPKKLKHSSSLLLADFLGSKGQLNLGMHIVQREISTAVSWTSPTGPLEKWRLQQKWHDYNMQSKVIQSDQGLWSDYYVIIIVYNFVLVITLKRQLVPCHW